MSGGDCAVHVRTGVPLAAVGTLLLAALAGCGGSADAPLASKSPAAILAASRAAATGATSVRITSRASQGRLSLTTDLWLSADGGRAKFSFLGLDYEVARIGETLYLKGTRALYRRLFARSGVRVPEGVWVKGPADAAMLARFAGLTDMGRTLDLLLGRTGPLTKTATSMVDGRPAIELKETAKLFTGSLAIATTGKPYPLRIVKHGRETGRTTFADWNQPMPLAAPASTIELSTLERGTR